MAINQLHSHFLCLKISYVTKVTVQQMRPV